MYFENCFTKEELKIEYRRLSLLLHPDRGGKTAAFQQMKNEYDQRIENISNDHSGYSLPHLFSTEGLYEYHRRAVKYVGIIQNHYYKVIQDFGADIHIDINHVNLIFTKRQAI